MPRATLSFNLPEESEEHKTALNGGSYKAALDEVYNKVFRQRRKYSELPEDQYKFLEELESEFHEILREWEVDL